MATGTILLPIGAANLPDGSANNAAPALLRVKSSAGAPTPYFLQLAFDAATQEQCCWSLRMPADYASALTMKVLYKMASATSGGVVIEGRAGAVTGDDSTDVDALDFDSANASGTSAVPGTAGYLKEISLTLTNADSVAAGDFMVVFLARSVAAGGDDATGDMEVVSVALTYTTS